MKAVVLAPNQLAAARLIEVLVRADNIWKEKSLLLTSRLSNSERSAIWQAIRDESSPIRLLVTTVGMISGVDVGVISKAYVLTRLSRIELLTVTGLLMRPYPGKEQGVIVDYVGSTDSMDLLGL